MKRLPLAEEREQPVARDVLIVGLLTGVGEKQRCVARVGAMPCPEK
jgi:hypothetical protein